MSVDKLVDSTQLNTDLTSVANAIRAKTGKSASIEFPTEFVSEIGSIETGGGDPYEMANQLLIGSVIEFESDVSGIISVKLSPFHRQPNLTKLSLPNVTQIGLSANGGNTADNFAASCPKLETINLPNVEAFVGNNLFRYDVSLEVVVLPKFKGISFQYFFGNCTGLTAFDCGDPSITNTGGFNQNDFYGATNLSVLILRHSVARSLSNINNFTNTPFASNGTGGTLYVPSALIPSYESATNWSTILGYENNQILPIEGSIYETQYADGTPIPSS